MPWWPGDEERNAEWYKRYRTLVWSASKARAMLKQYGPMIRSDAWVYTWSTRTRGMTKATWADFLRYVEFEPRVRATALMLLAQDVIWKPDDYTQMALNPNHLPLYIGEIIYWPVFS